MRPQVSFDGSLLPAASHTSFVGRQAQLTELLACVSEARLVTLTGPAGVGKTRLATALVERLRRRFRDRVVLVQLDALDRAELVPAAFVEALHVAESDHADLVSQLCGALGGPPTLLVVDGCDAVVQAAAQLIQRVLIECAQVTVLATSQERLGIAGERVRPVPPLDLPAGGPPYSPARAAAAGAVALFLDRARQVSPDLALDESNVEAVVDVVRRLSGLPLGIELAAAWSGILTPSELRSRLDQRHELLVTRDRLFPPRHASLEVAFDQSYDLLQPDEATLLQWLSLFAGGWTVDSMGAVCGIPAASGIPLLGRLVDRSLVEIDRDPGGTTRYRMLGVLREYLSKRLRGSPDLPAASDAFAAYYLALAEEAARAFAGAAGQAWLERVDTEMDNCRAALDVSLDRDPATALRLAKALGHYWAIRGRYEEGRVWLNAAIGACRGPTAMQASALRELAYLMWAQGDQAQAGEAACRALDVLERCGADRDAMVTALQQLSQISFEANDLDAARAWAERAVALTDDDAAPGVTGLALFRLATLRLAERRWDEASELLARSASLAERGQHLELRSMSLAYLGRAELLQDRPERAVPLLRQALELIADLGTPRQVTLILQLLAAASAAGGRPDRAACLASAATSIRGRTGVRARSAMQLDLEAELHRLMADRRLAAAVARGQGMDMAAAIRYALERPAGPDRPTPAKAPAGRPGGLSSRELEVAVLVTEGLSNRAIADRLFLSERTVEAHLEHVRTKLGFRSRAQIAAWVKENVGS